MAVIENLAELGPSISVTRHCGASWFDHKRNAISIDSSRSSLLRKHIVAHELNHFFLHVSTPYGQFLDELAKAELHDVVGYCNEHVKELPYLTIMVPIYELAKRLRNETELVPPKIYDLVDRYIRPWSHTQFVEDIFEGHKSCDQVTVDSAFRSLEFVEEHLRALGQVGGPIPPKMHKTVAVGNSERLALPTHTWRDEGRYSVGATQIFEGTAKIYENPPNRDKSDILKSPQYWSLYILFLYHTIYDDQPSPTEQVKRQLYNTFLGLCDLSLFTPIGSLYGSLRSGTTDWSEIHPGSRFFTALAVIKETGFVDDLDKDLLGWQIKISKALNWRTPPDYLILGSKSPHSRHSAACLKRLERHSAFLDLTVLPLKQYSEFLLNYLPLQYHAGETHGLICLPQGTAESPLGVVIGWVLERFARLAMRERPPKWDDLLPPRINYRKVFALNGGRQGIIHLLEQIDMLQLGRYRPVARP